jgi:gamma-glutamyltranspeptidase/glutathione hydrolase
LTLSKVLIAEKAAVASEQPLASLAGLEILKGGGNAMDAAVATSLTLAVTLHPAGGLGGDFFVLVYVAKTGKVHCLNSSGWAPSGLTLDLLRSKGERGIPLFGPCSVVVPGTVAGICALHKKFGTIELKKLSRAAVRYARDGFPISDSVCRAIGRTLGSFSGEAKKVFAPGGTPPLQGEMIRQTKLAEVIEAVAGSGATAFYRGWPAEEIVKMFIDNGIGARASDFSSFRPEWVDPLTLEYRGVSVYEVPPNSMGATCLLMLEFLAQHDLSRTKPLSRERVSLTMQAAELAYGRRDEMLGDPRFTPFDLNAFMELDGAGATSKSRLKGGDTTAFSVVDKEGNVVSAIQSLFHYFGSRVFVGGCGIMLNNRGAGFKTTGPNQLQPRKRPLHTLSALLLTKERSPYAAIGCSGGEFRPMQHALFVTNLVDYSMPLERSVDHPRFLRSGHKSMLAEEGYDNLGGLPYEVQQLTHPGGTGVCQGIEMLPGSRKAVCDVRGDGLPAGF